MFPDSFVTRFAPAPTGYLHLGHVVNAIYVWGIARARGGRVLLRIEDHDRSRCRAEYEGALLEDLEWLGFAADAPLVRQSERAVIYENALNQLRQKDIVYACGCSRTEIGGERYPGTCSARRLVEQAGRGVRARLEPTVECFVDLRLGMQEQRPAEQCGDVLVRDRHRNWTYQFAATVDDWVQGVTLVIRGEDLLDSTGRQIQLARLLGRSAPATFLHHPLLMKTPTQKVSKSDGDTGLRDLRAKGWTAPRVIGHAAKQAGLVPDELPVAADDVPGLFRGRGLTPFTPEGV